MPDGEKIGVLICFEDIIASVARESVTGGAEFWSALSTLLLSKIRSLWNNTSCCPDCEPSKTGYLVRVAGTGISCVLSPIGAIDYRSPGVSPDAFVASTHRLVYRTPYNRIGRLD